MRYELAIFDMDGTILDTLSDLTDSMNYCLQQYNMPLKTLEQIRSYVGNGIHRLIERAVPDGLNSTLVEEIYLLFKGYYKDHCAIKTKPYDGICVVIATLREEGIKTAFVSNKADIAVKSLCTDYFDGLFDYSVGDKEGMRIKPYPDGVNEVINYFDIPRKKCVYIGDSDVDFQTAKNAAIDVIMVGWGFRDEEFLHSIGAEDVIHTPEEIITIVNGR